MYENLKLDARVRHSILWTYQAICQLVKTKSFDQLTVSDIISKAGISRATFYRHFKSKEDVVKMKIDMFFTHFYEQLKDLNNNHNEEDEIILINQFFTHVGQEVPMIHLIISANLQSVMIEGIRTIIYSQKDQFYQFIPADKISEEYTIDLVSLSAWGLIARWIKNGCKESTKDLSNIYITSFKNIYLALFEDKEAIQGDQL